MQLTGIILAGGKSTRMGTDKALLKWGESTLIENAISICKTVCSNILISSNQQEHAKFGFPVFRDEIPGCGPISGINTCLNKSNTEWNLVLSVDAPFVSKDFLQFLLNHTKNFDAVVPKHNGGTEPLVALYRENTSVIFKSQVDKRDYKMQNALQLINTNFVECDEWLMKNKQLFSNLNSPADIDLNG